MKEVKVNQSSFPTLDEFRRDLLRLLRGDLFNQLKARYLDLLMSEIQKKMASVAGANIDALAAIVSPQSDQETEDLPAFIKRNPKGGYKVGGFSFASLEQAMKYAVDSGLADTPSKSLPMPSISSSTLDFAEVEDLPAFIKRNPKGGYKVSGFSFASLEQAMKYAVDSGLADTPSKSLPMPSISSSTLDSAEAEDLPAFIKRNPKGGYKVGGFSFASLEQAMAHAVSNGLVEIPSPLPPSLPPDQSETEDKSAEKMLSPENAAEYAGFHDNPIYSDGESRLDHLSRPIEEISQPSPEESLIDQCKMWVQAGGWVTAGKILSYINPSFSGKTSQFDFVKAVDILANIGFGVVPDPRYGLQIPKENEVVFLSELEEPDKHQNPSELCKKYLIELALGAFISQADGVVSDRERNILVDRIVAANIPESEQKYLQINLDWLLAVPVDGKILRRRLKKTDKEHQDILRSLMISIVLADGHPSVKEIAAIEDIYPLIGLDISTIYSDLHAGGIPDTLVVVQEAEPPAPGERIPDEESNQQPDYSLGLDRQRIAAIQSDTKVSSVLLNMNIAEETKDDLDNVPIIEESPLPGLNKNYAYFVRDVIEKEYWSEEELSALAKKHDLMTSGVFEAVNEWSFENYEDVLLDEYNGYYVAAELSEVLKTEFKKKGL